MLQVDLGRLDRERRVAIDEAIPADAALWKDTDADPRGPLHVALTAELAGNDVVVRGRAEGRIMLPCRRCLTDVTLEVGEDLALLFVEGLDPEEAQDEGVYAFDPRDAVLDLAEPIREQLLLALPRFAVCEEACRGLCPYCGKNLNEGDCECEFGELDDRWAALRKLKLD